MLRLPAEGGICNIQIVCALNGKYNPFKGCPNGLKSLMRGVVSISKASGKVVWGDPYTEVSQTA